MLRLVADNPDLPIDIRVKRLAKAIMLLKLADIAIAEQLGEVKAEEAAELLTLRLSIGHAIAELQAIGKPS